VIVLRFACAILTVLQLSVVFLTLTTAASKDVCSVRAKALYTKQNFMCCGPYTSRCLQLSRLGTRASPIQEFPRTGVPPVLKYLGSQGIITSRCKPIRLLRHIYRRQLFLQRGN
jgi:hypothetical protein